MRSQPNRNYQSEDRVMTPPWLAKAIVQRLQPRGVILEPCAGTGNLLAALKGYGDVEWCEIDQGRDFFRYTTPVDWIITNPPWSQFGDFLEHSLRLANHVALMATVNHWWTRRRCALVQGSQFGYRRLLLIDPIREFPTTGFQLGMMVVSRNWSGLLQMQKIVNPEGPLLRVQAQPSPVTRRTVTHAPAAPAPQAAQPPQGRRRRRAPAR